MWKMSISRLLAAFISFQNVALLLVDLHTTLGVWMTLYIGNKSVLPNVLEMKRGAKTGRAGTTSRPTSEMSNYHSHSWTRLCSWYWIHFGHLSIGPPWQDVGTCLASIDSGVYNVGISFEKTTCMGTKYLCWQLNLEPALFWLHVWLGIRRCIRGDSCVEL